MICRRRMRTLSLSLHGAAQTVRRSSDRRLDDLRMLSGNEREQTAGAASRSYKMGLATGISQSPWVTFSGC